MAFVIRSVGHQTTRPLGLDPVVVGTACCIASALCYTAANICLRKLAALGCDEMWVTCIKELVTVVAIGPWLLISLARGLPAVPLPRPLIKLILVGLAVQLAGNLSVQWAFGVVGLAITVPAIFGIMLIASALMGLLLLGERVSARSAAAIALLISSIALLSLGAGAANRSVTAALEAAPSPMRAALGVGAGCLAGIMFAALSTTIRHTATAQVPVTSIVFVVTGTGVVSMGTLSVWRLGVQPLLATEPEKLRWMLAAGAFNLIAFLAITKGLQLTTLVHVGVLNASQIAMAAVAGMMLFAEPPTPWLLVGVALTILGVLLIGRPVEEDQELASV